LEHFEESGVTANAARFEVRWLRVESYGAACAPDSSGRKSGSPHLAFPAGGVFASSQNFANNPIFSP
jgi:hypothetical protein